MIDEASESHGHPKPGRKRIGERPIVDGGLGIPAKGLITI
jgi:hypothetical protein